MGFRNQKAIGLESRMQPFESRRAMRNQLLGSVWSSSMQCSPMKALRLAPVGPLAE